MKQPQGSRYQTLSAYILREFLLSLLVASIFFFFIFFINQLLLFAQKILLKSVNLWSVLQLVGLATPQILLYTIPFSTLTASAMVIGDLTERNEILAFRSSGIAMRRIFAPLLLSAALLSVVTFFVADTLLPYSNVRFRTLYATVMESIPTLEIESYSVTHIGTTMLVTGEVDDGTIESLLIFDTSNQSDHHVISAKKGRVALIHPETFLYKLTLEDPVIILSDSISNEHYTVATSEKLVYYLDFSTQLNRYTDITPSQLSIRDLLSAIRIRQGALEEERSQQVKKIESLEEEVGSILFAFEQESFDSESLLPHLTTLQSEIELLKKETPRNYYIQYYRAEIHKKLALSASCLLLVTLTFPLSLLKLKHGRLFGFALSLVISSLYWFLLFFAQTKILDVPFHPGFLLWGPNAIASSIFIWFLIRSRRI